MIAAHKGLRGRLAALTVGWVLMLGAFPAGAMTEQQTRGKQIYLAGTSPGGGEISVIVGTEGVALPASAAPCASCHGPDGTGRPEGGVQPPDIRWSQLTKIYGHVHENGRSHPKFTEANLARSLRSGLDPADNSLDRSMPLYRMSDRDMDDLIAYIQYLEFDHDPGVADDRLQVATLLPLRGPSGRLGQAVAQVMHGYFEDINERGGIYGRRIELLAIPFGTSLDATLEALREALRREGIFALVGAHTVGLDAEILDLLRAENVPLVGPFTLDPGDQFSNASVFYIYSGFDEQARVLVDHALEDAGGEPGGVLVVGPDNERGERLVGAVGAQVRKHRAEAPEVVRYRPGELDVAALVGQVREKGIGSVLFFGRQDGLDALLGGLTDAGQHPRVHLLSSFLSRPLFEAPAGFNHKLFVAYPTLARDIDQAGRAAYTSLAQRHALPPEHVQAQMAAFAAAKLLEEGLRRAGSKLDREALVKAIEDLYAFKTGVTPPLSYGPNRRIGALGAHVVVVDLLKRSYEPTGGWRELR